MGQIPRSIERISSFIYKMNMYGDDDPQKKNVMSERLSSDSSLLTSTFSTARPIESTHI